MQQPDMSLIERTADIAAAFVSNNPTPAEDVPGLVSSIFTSLSALGAEPSPPPEPACSARASVRPDHVTCMVCGKKMKMLKRHLMTDHGMTADEYRAAYNLPHDHPIVAPNYADKRRDLAKAIGLGRKPGQKVKRK